MIRSDNNTEGPSRSSPTQLEQYVKASGVHILVLFSWEIKTFLIAFSQSLLTLVFVKLSK